MRKKVAVIIVSVLGFFLIGVFCAEMWIRHSVRVAIERALGGAGAEVELGRVLVSLPLRQVSVRDVRLRAHGDDTSVGASLVSFELSVPRLTLRGVAWNRVGERPLLSASRLTIDSPRATLVTHGSGNAHGGFIDTLTTPVMPAILVDEVAVTGAALELVRWTPDGTHTRLVLGGASASATGATLDSLPATLSLRADSLFYTPPGASTVLRADTIALDTRDATISLAALSLIPQFGKAEFAELSPGHADWTSLRLGAITCRGVDFARLLSPVPALAIDTIALASASLASYKDRHIHSPATRKPLLHETIRSLPIPTEIRALAFRDLDITYEELAERAATPGIITLTGAHGHASNITNIPAGHTTIDISATLMHSAALTARLTLPTAPADERWQLTGRLGPTDMRAFNAAVEPLMNARLASGAIRSLDFDIAATATRSHTSLTMSYENLRVELLDRHDHTRVRHFLTAVADDILIRPDNPTRGGPLRTAESDTTRDPERSMWNYIWRSLEGAILKTLI